MKANSRKILAVSFCAFVLVCLLLLNLSSNIPKKPRPAAKREISIDITVEKPEPKPEMPKPKVSPPPETSKGPAVSSKRSEGKVLNGTLPPISANYRKYLGFRRYAEAMTNRGAGFYLLGSSKKQIYKIDFAAKSLSPVPVSEITRQNFSSRTRLIEDEPALRFYFDKAETAYKISNARVILLVPQAMEHKIAAGFSAKGIDSSKFRGFKGEYLIISGQLILKITEGVSNTARQSMDIEIAI